MSEYSIIYDTILSLNNRQIDFKHNINKVLKVKGILIIHLFDSIDKKGSINMAQQPINSVYAISSDGDILWNIKDIFQEDNMYTNISIDANDNLVVNTFMGIAQVINVTTKQVIGNVITK